MKQPRRKSAAEEENERLEEEYDKLADLTELYAHETDQDTIKWMIRTLHETMFGTEEKRWQK